MPNFEDSYDQSRQQTFIFNVNIRPFRFLATSLEIL
jgi:hypothetical protein